TYAGRAVALLRAAVQRGYTTLATLEGNPDLEAILRRADFQEILADLRALRPTAVERVGDTVKLPVGQDRSLQMKSKKVMRFVNNRDEKVVHVWPSTNDPTTLLLRGLKPGVSRLTLRDATGATEDIQLVVE